MLPATDIELSVLDKPTPCSAENKGHVVFRTFIVKALDPFIMARPCAAVIFPVAKNLFDLSRRKVLLNAYRANERSAHDPLVLEGQIQQNGNSFICSALVLTSDVKHDIFPAVIPIAWQVVSYPFGTFCQQKELHVGALVYDFPCLITPLVGFLQKEIRRHADPQHLSAFHLVLTAPVFGKRISETRFCSVNLRTVLVPKGIKIVHITILASFTAFFAAVPRIPYIVQRSSPLPMISSM